MKEIFKEIVEKHDLKRADRKQDIVANRAYFCYHLYSQGYRYDWIGEELLGKDRTTAFTAKNTGKNMVGHDYKMYLYAHSLIKDLNDIVDIQDAPVSSEWVLRKAVHNMKLSSWRKKIFEELEPIKVYIKNNYDPKEVDESLNELIIAIFEIDMFAKTADLIEEIERIKELNEKQL